MPRRLAPLLGLLALAAGCGGGGARPDVLLVVVDTLRADHLGSYGHPAEATPEIDALAAESVLFERALAASPSTAPSHASLMTSRFPRGHSIGPVNGRTRLDDEEPTLAEAFTAAGYETAAFVSNYVLREARGLGRGFGLYDDEYPSAERNRPHMLERRAHEVGPKAVEWLGERGERPWFLWVHFQDPHGPYEPPERYVERYAPAEGERGERLPVLSDQKGRRGIPAYQALPGLRHAGEYRARYVGEVAHADHWVGKVVDAAERASGEGGLVVLFTSDHGERLGESGLYFVHGAATLPPEIHVPLLLRAPGLEAERRSEPVHHVDVAPTLLEAAGLPPLEGARGIALGPLARGERPPPARSLYSERPREVGLYHGPRYLRLNRRGPPAARGFRSFVWTERGLQPVRRPFAGLRRRVRQYLAQPLELARDAASTSPEERERLRALGYLEPDS